MSLELPGVKGDRWRYPRWRVCEEMTGRMASRNQVSVLDISLGGALIEHFNLVRPGSPSFLSLVVQGAEISLRCRVVRTRLHRHELWPTGEHGYVYRTGLEFLALSEESRRLLTQYIDFLGEQARAPLSA
ncbi:MAG: PilZ domain-containing protein [Candidatus Methylomirabilales bacterium]